MTKKIFVCFFIQVNPTLMGHPVNRINKFYVYAFHQLQLTRIDDDVDINGRLLSWICTYILKCGIK